MRQTVIILLVFLLSSCTYLIDLKDIDDSSRLFIRCFPGEQDTTFVELFVATPSNEKPKQIGVDNASVSVYCREKVVLERALWRGDNFFYAVFSANSGDRVKVSANMDGVEEVVAESVFPEAPKMTVATREEKGKLVFEINIPNQSEDKKYGMRLVRKERYISDESYLDGQKIIRKDLEEEEMMTWTFPEEDEGTLYDDLESGRMRCEVNGNEMFLFTGKEAVDGMISLEIPVWYHEDYVTRYYEVRGEKQLAVYRYYYRVDLYSVSDEMFDYFEAKKRLDNNSFSEIGFAPMNFRVGNVRGGFGVVGCCSQISSGWIPNINAMPDYDNIDDGIRVLHDWLVDF